MVAALNLRSNLSFEPYAKAPVHPYRMPSRIDILRQSLFHSRQTFIGAIVRREQSSTLDAVSDKMQIVNHGRVLMVSVDEGEINLPDTAHQPLGLLAPHTHERPLMLTVVTQAPHHIDPALHVLRLVGVRVNMDGVIANDRLHLQNDAARSPKLTTDLNNDSSRRDLH